MTTATPSQNRILVVDDEPDLRTLYELTLIREGYCVMTAGTLALARELLQTESFDLLITDMRLPDGLGLELALDSQATRPCGRFIVITAYGSAENAVESLKAGAFDYLTKPVDLRQLRSVVRSALQEPAQTQHHTNRIGTPKTFTQDRAASSLQRLVGSSAVMQAVRERIVKVAGSMAPVLIFGESGTGKELVARAIHDCSHRGDQPFVAVNCGAIPENLLEAEFFGAKKGAYTGAAQDRDGFFQAANGGTLFLDEIGDLPLAMQTKLLRAIQERRVRPLGGTQELAVDVRIVSATHRNLADEVQELRFRQDLYYRLNVIDIALPPLRERMQDLPELCRALLQRIATESGVSAPQPSEALIEKLGSMRLAGNVRELENLLHRALALGDGGFHLADFGPTLSASIDDFFPAAPAATVADAPAPDGNEPHLPDNLQIYLDQIERDVLVRALREHRYNRTAAAASLGLNVRQVRYRMARLNIAIPKEFEEPGHGN
jgi:two-component system response regulator PilR (NtrC family)